MTVALGLAEELAEAWNARDPHAVAARYAADAVRWELALSGARVVGRDAIARHVGSWMAAVPDGGLAACDAGAAGDLLTIEWTLAGTHLGDLPGLPARGEPLELAGASVIVLGGGLIASERVYWDSGVLLLAAGVLD